MGSAPGEECSRAGGRADPGGGRARNGQDPVVPCSGGLVAVGLGSHHASDGRDDLLPAPRNSLPAAWNVTRDSGLSTEGRLLRPGRFRTCPESARPGATPVPDGPDATLGPRLEPGRADRARFRPYSV